MRNRPKMVALLAVALAHAACGSSTQTPRVIDAVAACGEAGGDHVFHGDLNSETVELELDGGVPVILKRTPGNPVVAVRLFIVGGSRNLTSANAGIEDLALSIATTGGPAGMTKAEYSARLNAMGSSIGAGTDLDYSDLSLSSLRIYLDDSWALLRQVLRSPGFPGSEVERLRDLHVQAILMRQENPDDLVIDEARALLFAGHPYGNQPRGTTEVPERLTRDELMTYYAGLIDASRLLLVVVGDVTEEDLRRIVGDTFVDLPRAAAPLSPPPVLSAPQTQLNTVSAAIPTNYIIGLAPAPAPTDEDYAAVVLLMRHLRDRFFEEVRTARNLSYAVSASIGARLANYSSFYVTTVDPQAAIVVMYDEMRALRAAPLEARVLTDLVSVFVTRYYTGLDSNGAVATELGWWELFGGGRENADRYIDRLRAVTPADIQRAANAYLGNFQVAVVGDPDSVSLELFEGP